MGVSVTAAKHSGVGDTRPHTVSANTRSAQASTLDTKTRGQAQKRSRNGTAKSHASVLPQSSHGPLSLMVTVNAAGQRLPAFFVSPSIDSMISEGQAESGVTAVISDTGKMTVSTMKSYIKWLNDNIPSSTPRPILLILDGHPAHVHSETLFCFLAYKIVPFKMHSNSTHIWQVPDDERINGQIKRQYKQRIRVRHRFKLSEGSKGLVVTRRIAAEEMNRAYCSLSSCAIRRAFEVCGYSLPFRESCFHEVSECI